MLNKISIRWRLTILSALLLSITCIALTVVLNLTAFRAIDLIDAAAITEVASGSEAATTSEAILQSELSSASSENTVAAKKGYSSQSIIYMLMIIIGGSALTYYISGRALKPLDILSDQVVNLNVHNLSKTLEVPPTKDEIAKLTASFNEMSDKMNDAFLMQKHFSASAAHELRSPLAVLQTKLDVFKKRSLHTSEEYDAIINVFEKQIERLRGLVSSLLSLTNMDDEREMSEVSGNVVFEDIMLELSGLAKSKNVSLTLQCDDNVLKGNIDLLYRAFYNIVENGIKYNVDGGYVHIEASKQLNNKVKVLISDSGIGIPNEMKNKIFEPFYRVDQSRSREMGGAGLGLSIVNSIIKKHGGTIEVINHSEGGTCFSIII